MTTREQVRADTALIERLTAELAAERAKQEEVAVNAFRLGQALQKEAERRRAAEARVRALETGIRSLMGQAQEFAATFRKVSADLVRQGIHGGNVDGAWASEAFAKDLHRLLSGSGETAKAPPAAEPECPDCGGGLWLGSVTLGTIRACPRCLPQDPAQSTDGREGA